MFSIENTQEDKTLVKWVFLLYLVSWEFPGGFNTGYMGISLA